MFSWNGGKAWKTFIVAVLFHWFYCAWQHNLRICLRCGCCFWWWYGCQVCSNEMRWLISISQYKTNRQTVQLVLLINLIFFILSFLSRGSFLHHAYVGGGRTYIQLLNTLTLTFSLKSSYDNGSLPAFTWIMSTLCKMTSSRDARCKLVLPNFELRRQGPLFYQNNISACWH